MSINSQDVDQFFDFSNSLEPILEKYANAIVLPIGIQSKEELLRIYSNIIPGITGYFGENWNALHEILRDFRWLDERQKNIVIFHQDILEIKNREDFKIYLEILADAVEFWKTPELMTVRSLKVSFPLEQKQNIVNLL